MPKFKDFQIVPSHVALLVSSAGATAEKLAGMNFNIGPDEVWDGEGTLEKYIEGDQGNSLLLMQPVKPGAYQRALEKRGQGLHHLAIDVLDIDAYLASLVGTGWLLHLSSIKTLKAVKTAYLARPGFPGLIEVQQKPALLQRKFFVERIGLPMKPEFAPLLESIGLDEVVEARTSGPLELVLSGKTWRPFQD